MKKPKRFGKIFYSVVILLSGITLGIIFQPVISGDNIFMQQRKLDQVLQTANKNYVDRVDINKMVEAAIRGMLGQLDPHSVYIPPKATQEANEDFQGSFDGIGVEFDIIDDTITVITAIAGGPSDSIGIMSGDKIVEVDGKDVIGIQREEVPKKLKGPRGTHVEVGIKRSGEDSIITYDIVRGKIPLNSIQAAFMVDGTNTGVILLSKFSATTHREIVDSVFSLKRQGMKKLILDLRGNPGGLLKQAFLTADEFLGGGDTIVYTIGRKRQFDEVYLSTDHGNFRDLPIIILIGPGSASASEIVSGAIQDLDRGLIVGMTSFGKGLVQRPYSLFDGSSFRLTIARYYTPSGRSIQRPYDDRTEYRSWFGRIDFQDGAYIDDILGKLKTYKDTVHHASYEVTGKYVLAKYKKHKNSAVKIDTMPVFHTRKGRTVLGGGGITPDYVLKYDTINVLSRRIRNKNLFTRFADGFLQEKGKELRLKYENNFIAFLRHYDPDEKTLNHFRDYVVEKGVKWNDSLYVQDKDYLITSIKANIARAIWDRNRYLQVYYTNDKMVNKAVDLFPMAQKISGLGIN